MDDEKEGVTGRRVDESDRSGAIFDGGFRTRSVHQIGRESMSDNVKGVWESSTWRKREV